MFSTNTFIYKVSSCSPHNLTKRGSVEFVRCCVPLIATIFPCNASRPGQDKSLGILVQLATCCPWTLRAQVGVEPIAFYCFGPSKKPRQHDILLLTLTKLGTPCWTRTSVRNPTEWPLVDIRMDNPSFHYTYGA